jgi:hypothetical protein
MSLFSALFNVGIARRVGLWALIQALPNEDALRNYLRAAYLGLAGVIIGSVLTGAALAVGIVAIYHLLIEAGWEESLALASTAGSTLLLILGCFAMAGHWFVQLANIKGDLSLTKNSKAFSVTGLVSDAVQNVTEGFIEGLNSTPTTKTTRPANTSRRIRLIN